MKTKEMARKSRGLILTLTLIITLSFLYGCQCEGGIGTTSTEIETKELISNDLTKK